MQTEAYKETVAEIKITIIHRHHPEVKLDKSQHNIIQEKPLTAVNENPSGETPQQFLNSRFAQGVFWITCVNESSKV